MRYVLALLLAGCYASHGRGDALDAGRFDAGRVDPGTCDESKLHTSGLAESFALGAQCEFLVACFDAPRDDLFELAGATCTGEVDYACGDRGVRSCIAHVDTIDEAEHALGCMLTLAPEVNAVVCAGDL
jgi:hypothetical protein